MRERRDIGYKKEIEKSPRCSYSNGYVTGSFFTIAMFIIIKIWGLLSSTTKEEYILFDIIILLVFIFILHHSYSMNKKNIKEKKKMIYHKFAKQEKQE